MGHIDTFEEFVEKKAEEKQVDWDKRKSNWISSVNGLYNQIKLWLAPSIEKGHIKVLEKPIELIEDYLGKYKINRLDIYVGSEKVSLIPKGSLIVGAYGRIDFEGNRKDVMFIEEDWNNWHVAQRNIHLKTFELNETSFKNLVRDFIDG